LYGGEGRAFEPKKERAANWCPNFESPDASGDALELARFPQEVASSGLLMDQSTDKNQKNHAPERYDLRAELDRLESMIADLKVQYEQYFLGVSPFAPDKLHGDVKRQIRLMLKAPFKNSAISFRLKTLEGRYNTFNTYWQRVLKQREDGTYHKDVFKASLREKNALEDARAGTAVGQAEKNMQSLFNSYKDALEKQTGKKQTIDFQAFQKSLIQRAKDFKEQTGVKKLSFKVVVKDGKVVVQACSKE
jgi:hypothetical protein